MPGDRPEPNRVLGFPVKTRPQAAQGAEPPALRGAQPDAPRGEESQRVLGIPVDWLDQAGRVVVPALQRPLRAVKNWARRRPSQ